MQTHSDDLPSTFAQRFMPFAVQLALHALSDKLRAAASRDVALSDEEAEELADLVLRTGDHVRELAPDIAFEAEAAKQFPKSDVITQTKMVQVIKSARFKQLSLHAARLTSKNASWFKGLNRGTNSVHAALWCLEEI
jgi:hypothetical protein